MGQEILRYLGEVDSKLMDQLAFVWSVISDEDSWDDGFHLSGHGLGRALNDKWRAQPNTTNSDTNRPDLATRKGDEWQESPLLLKDLGLKDHIYGL